jgi:ATP-binding cassette, subfamily B, bacterial PglK
MCIRERIEKFIRFDYFRKIFSLLGEDRRKLPWLVFLFLIASTLDLIGLGLIGPYVALVINSDKVMDNWISVLMVRLGAPDGPIEILITLSLGLVVVFFVKAIMAIFINHAILQFCLGKEHRLRLFLMEAYQRLPYTEYLKRNSSEYIYSVQMLAGTYSNGVLQSLLRFTSEGLVAIVIVAMLAWTNIEALTILILLLGVVVVVYDRLFRKKTHDYGYQVVEHTTRIVQGINEGIEGFKEVRILGKEDYFHGIVRDNSMAYRQAAIRSTLISQAPRFIFEAVLISFLVLLVIGTLWLGQGLEQLAPTLGIFGMAALRLMPCANVFIGSITNLRFANHGTSLLYDDLQQLKAFEAREATSKSLRTPVREGFKRLQLKEVHFQYPGASHKALADISLVLTAGESIGLVGPSGSGKTTMVDVILGLLEPQAGELLYNDHPLQQSLSAWRCDVAYLPQQVFLIDNTLRRNVALGVEDGDIDDHLLLEALDQARLAEVVEQLPQGVETFLGERGVRLSGGQRQRVALARAFYHKRNVLIMDEATSALDNETEQEIVEAIRRFKGQKTMVVIAHRLTTVQHCDRIYQLDNGRIVKVGSYEDVVGKDQPKRQ